MQWFCEMVTIVGMRKMGTWQEKCQEIQSYWKIPGSCKICFFGEEQSYAHPNRHDVFPYKFAGISSERTSSALQINRLYHTKLDTWVLCTTSEKSEVCSLEFSYPYHIKGTKPFMDSNLNDFFVTTEIATDIWVLFALETAFRKALGRSKNFSTTVLCG